MSINNISSTPANYYSVLPKTTDTSAAKTTDDKATSKSAVGYSNRTSLGSYLNSVSTDKADAKTMFSKLSIDVGGDGKSITKDQLTSYLDKAKSGTVSIPDQEKTALQTLKDNWDKVADGGDKINYANVTSAGYTSTIKSMVPDNSKTTVDKSSDFADSKATIDNQLISSALGTSTSSSSTNSYSSVLKTLLSGTTDENDDSNANLIATLTNLIANSKSTSTVETEA
jgi:hypothetical protein